MHYMKLNWEFIRQIGFFTWFFRTILRKISVNFLNIDNTLTLPNGVIIELPKESPNANSIYVSNANQDWGSEAVLVKFLDKKKSFIDVGAHIGYYSLWVSPFCKEVYAFEPDKRNLPFLSRNQKRVNNLIVVEKAITLGGADKVLFDVSGESTINHLTDAEEVREGIIEVPAISIDDFVSENRLEICGIKIDVEGYDLDVVRSAEETMKKQSPVFLIEFYEGIKNNKEDLFRMVEKNSYSIFAFVKPIKIDGTYNYGEIIFREVNQINYDKFRKIMLFLVPSRLHSAFKSLEEK